MEAIAAFLFCIIPVFDGVVRDSVELIEVNHCYEPTTGEERFVSVNYWDRHGVCLHVREWHMLRHADFLYGINAGSGFRSVFQRDDGTAIVVTAKRFKETQTPYDSEELDRRVWPIEMRRPLGK